MRLTLKQDMITLHRHSVITDEQGKVLFEAKTKVLSLHDYTSIVDQHDHEVARLSKKLISFHQVHYIDIFNGPSFELSAEILHVFQDVLNIKEAGIRLHGDFLHHDYTITDEEDHLLADVRRKLISLHSTYEIDVHDESRVVECVAIVIALQHINEDRQAAAASSNG